MTGYVLTSNKNHSKRNKTYQFLKTMSYANLGITLNKKETCLKIMKKPTMTAGFL